ncbi:MAG: hypothetical protein HQL82_11890 [Magnetococcales bacterium]|nr:hypothetical protein [Magnetococcales bacterium]
MTQSALKAKEIIVRERREIVKIIVAALVEDHPVQVYFGKKSTCHYSRFQVGVDQFEDIQAGEYLDIAPLDPPTGNIRIRGNPDVTLCFFTSSFSVDAQVRFRETTARRSLRLSFPEALNLTDQKRSAVRVAVEPKWDLIVKVIRPSGLSFVAKAQDLSAGGICFQSLGAVPSLFEKARIRLILHWPSANMKADANAVMVKQFTQEGNTCFRARFLFDAQKTAGQVEEIVAALQRRHLQHRRDLFGE